MIYYLQPCTFTGTNNRTSEKIRDYLAQQGVAICGCCHYSQGLFQPGDTVLFICDACAAVTGERAPQAKLDSVYRYLLDDEHFIWPNYGGEQITLQDSWALRNYPQVQEEVRDCLKRMNFTAVELPNNWEKADFEGPARYKHRSQRKLSFAPTAMAAIDEQTLPEPKDGIQAEMQRHAAQYTTKRAVAYTNGTLGGIQMGGANGVHILDLITRDMD